MALNERIAALLRERDGYTRAGNTKRAAEVDKQLSLHGYRDAPADPKETAPPVPQKAQPETASLEAPETATIPRGRPRRSDPNA